GCDSNWVSPHQKQPIANVATSGWAVFGDAGFWAGLVLCTGTARAPADTNRNASSDSMRDVGEMRRIGSSGGVGRRSRLRSGERASANARDLGARQGAVSFRAPRPGTSSPAG